jgi:two-component system, chemotaxis family, CheB/CheR fusion protein
MSDEVHRDAGPRAPRVLLVDDYVDGTEILRMLLTHRGFEVTTALSMATALAVITAAPVDVLVSDIRLPDGSGYDLLRGVRAARRLPAIALSGMDSDADLWSAHEAGFDEYLVKPVSIDRLVDVLRRVSRE